MIGWIFLLVPMAMVLYAGIRVGPEYLNYYKVVTAMKETAIAAQERRDADSDRPSAVRSRSASTRATSTTIDGEGDRRRRRATRAGTMTADYEDDRAACSATSIC